MEPTQQFRGIWLRAEACERLRKRELTNGDARFVFTVLACSEDNRGCPADRKALARMLNIKPARISQIIRKLKSLSPPLLVEHEQDGQGYYQITW